ncbi:MAG TPA: DUF6801 domain-containing protein [Actinophytocola sp.]|nr:DUF6801 domain-containing protein [Actinophytocola sp.]
MNGTRRLGAAGAVAVLACLATPVPAGAQDEPTGQRVSAELAYTCLFPSGEQPVTLGVTAAFAPATAGDPVQPADPALRVTLPPPALADLTAAGATQVTAVVRLATTVTRPSGEEPGSWSGAHVTPAPLPAEGDLVLDAPAQVKRVLPEAAGEITYTAGALSVELTGYRADGTATEPPVVGVDCTADPEQDTTLATVPVAAVAEESPSSSAAPPVPDASGGSAERERQAAPEDGSVPPECHLIPDVPPEYRNAFCAYLTGFTSVAKLKASAFQPAGIQNIMVTNFDFTCDEGPGILCQRALTQPDFGGEPKLPPAPNWFLNFGFVPVEATMQLTQEGLGEVYQWSKFIPGSPPSYAGLTTAKVKLWARIYDVEVNGVPLDVGPGCRTEVPIDATLTATYDSYSINEGGLLQGTVTIPPFSGCGVTEDLDPLFTGAISGPGNHVRMTQGEVCAFAGNKRGCPPQIPEPL